MSLLKLLRDGSYDVAFVDWFQARQELERLDTGLSEYPVTELMGLLGVSQRSYQYWEARASSLGYPVPIPCRVKWGFGEIRVYTPRQVVDVAFWFWDRRIRGGVEDKRKRGARESPGRVEREDFSSIMTISEVAAYLRLSREDVRGLVLTDGLPVFGIGKRWRVKRDSLDKWIEKRSMDNLVEVGVKEDEESKVEQLPAG